MVLFVEWTRWTRCRWSVLGHHLVSKHEQGSVNRIEKCELTNGINVWPSKYRMRYGFGCLEWCVCVCGWYLLILMTCLPLIGSFHSISFFLSFSLFRLWSWSWSVAIVYNSSYLLLPLVFCFTKKRRRKSEKLFMWTTIWIIFSVIECFQPTK